jgi:hypothetical protein
VAQERTGLDPRLAVRVDVRVVHEVAGHQVDRAFDALEVAADGARERPQDRGLADADVALEQHVAAGEQSYVDEADRVLLTDDDLADFIFQAQCAFTPLL